MTEDVAITELRQLEILVQAIPTDHVGKIGETPVRIWQACTEDGSNFLFAVAAVIPFSSLISVEVKAILDRELSAKGGHIAVDPIKALSDMQAEPDGRPREWVQTDARAYWKAAGYGPQ